MPRPKSNKNAPKMEDPSIVEVNKLIPSKGSKKAFIPAPTIVSGKTLAMAQDSSGESTETLEKPLAVSRQLRVRRPSSQDEAPKLNGRSKRVIPAKSESTEDKLKVELSKKIADAEEKNGIAKKLKRKATSDKSNTNSAKTVASKGQVTKNAEPEIEVAAVDKPKPKGRKKVENVALLEKIDVIPVTTTKKKVSPKKRATKRVAQEEVGPADKIAAKEEIEKKKRTVQPKVRSEKKEKEIQISTNLNELEPSPSQTTIKENKNPIKKSTKTQTKVKDSLLEGDVKIKINARKRTAASANDKMAELEVEPSTSRKRVAAKASAKTKDNTDTAATSKKPKKTKTGGALLNPTDSLYIEADFDLPSDPKLAKTERFNFKISSWNVAGLRSWVKKDGLKFIDFEAPDIFCLQETKCTTEQLPEEVKRLPGYHPYWLCKTGGYAGVAIYSKIMPINVVYGIGNEEHDANGRMITAEYEKYYLINVYVPNSGRKLVNLDARMRWEEAFLEFIKGLDALKPVIICGDMNVSHTEIDLANPKSNTKSAGFTKEERNKMSELLAAGFIDTFRDLYPEKIGAYTYWTYMSNARARNIGWRLDYFIVSERLKKRVVDNCIRDKVNGSDHCPITLFLKF